MPVLPKWPSVLMHFDGPKIVMPEDIAGTVSIVGTANGLATVDKFSDLANQTFELKDSQYVQITHGEELYAAGSFTISWWENLSIFNTNSASLIFSAVSPTTSYCGIMFGFSNGGKRQIFGSSTGSSWNLFNGSQVSSSLDYGQWIHWELSYDADTKTFYVFKNGELVLSKVITGSPINSSTRNTYIGQYNGYFVEGCFADFEFLNGVCKHTENFTPDPPSHKYLTMTLNNLFTSEIPKFNKSINLSGSGLSFTENLLGTTDQDWTISFWEYLLANVNQATSFVLNLASTSSNNGAMLLGQISSGNKVLYLGSTGTGWGLAQNIVLTTVASLLNKWTHWEVCYKQSIKTIYVFIDGVLKYSKTLSAPLYQGAFYSYLGYHPVYKAKQSGYYDELLVLPGVCLHTESFTPPDEPYSLPNEKLHGIALTNANIGNKKQVENSGITAAFISKSVLNPRIREGISPSFPIKAVANSGKRIGYLTNYLSPGNKKLVNRSGAGLFVSFGNKQATNYTGSNIDFLIADSNGFSKFDLLVTPTHIYKTQSANVVSSYRFPTEICGRHQLRINDNIVMPWGNYDRLNTLDFNITQSMLEEGKNSCRLELDVNGEIKFLDFDVTKEESQRTRVERTFAWYDGGYNGDVHIPTFGYIDGFNNTFMVPIEQDTTLITTTDYTGISLKKYTTLQGVNVDGCGLNILVSFDKGITWKTWNQTTGWSTCDISEISDKGMTVSTINSITLAQWSEVFRPNQLDFAIYLNNKLENKLIRPAEESLLWSGSVRPSSSYSKPATATSEYIVPDGFGVSRIDWSAYGGYNNDGGTPKGTGSITYYYEDGSSETRISVCEFGGKTYSGSDSYGAFHLKRPTGVYLYGYTSTGKYVGTASVSVYGAPLRAYIKSIDVQITPRLKTGYAFIM